VLRTVAAWVAWWVALFWLWMLLVGDWNHIEWIGGACVAAVAATIAELGRSLAGVSIRPSLAPIKGAPLAWLVVFSDFAILMHALVRSLVRREVVRGRYLVRASETGEKTTSRGAAYRAWTVLVAGYSPNAYVVDIDPDAGTVLVHDLVPRRKSEEPA
jgi:multisubunit Na+/H+ antiporter MnhE subunit